jgi:superfamily II DNA or RNA helicase
MTKRSLIKLRKDQKKGVEACFQNPKGRIIIPTGGGKTLIAQESIRQLAVASDKPTVSVIFVPRIMLAKQWIKSTGAYLIQDYKMRFNFLNINSGKLASKIKNDIEQSLFDIMGHGIRPILSTTSPLVSDKEIKSLITDDYHVVIISTYHSSQVLTQSQLMFNSTWYDECHFLATDNQFFESTKINSHNKYFLTATPRTTDSDDGMGMNNESVYGPVIFQQSPKELIHIGAIVPPHIHIVGTTIQLNNDALSQRGYDDLLSLVISSFDKHKNVIKANSVEPDRIGAKMLVVCNGQLPLQGIFSARTFRLLRKDRSEIKIYGLSTDFGIYIDGTHHVNTNAMKEEFLYALNQLEDNDDAIIFHVDMIAEGLDVPGITGILPLRNLGQTKFLQNIGRASRLHILDREKITNGSLKPRQYTQYIKPCCYVILPYCLANPDDFMERNFNIIMSLRSNYDFDPSEHIILDLLNPTQAGPDFDEDDLNRQIRGLTQQITNQLKDFYHQLEDEEFNEEEFLFALKFRSFLAGNMDAINLLKPPKGMRPQIHGGWLDLRKIK